jgi:hypothetical protein
VFLTDTICVPDKQPARLCVISIGSLIAAAPQRFLVDGSTSDL